MSLLQARETIMLRFRSSLRLFNITEQQWRVLRALSSIEKIEVTELANATLLLSPSLSRILKDMEERGFIVKEPVSEDLRRVLVSIAPSGLVLIDAIAPYSEGIYAEISSTFGKEKMRLLQDLLKELVTGVENLPSIHYAENELSGEASRLPNGHIRGRPPKKNRAK